MDSTEDQVLYARLLTAIGTDGVGERTSQGVVINALEGRTLSQPMCLRVTPESFGRLLRDSAGTSAGAFPEVEPLEAAWRLFLVHLDEAIQTARPGETELVPSSYGVDSLRPDMTRAPITAEQQKNRDDQRRYDRLIEHFADRGRVELEWEAQTIVIDELDGRQFRHPVRIRIPFGAFCGRLRRAEEPDEEWARLAAEIDAAVGAGRSDMELRSDGSLHHRS